MYNLLINKKMFSPPTTEAVTCIGHLEQNWKMLLILEGWVRRMARAQQGEPDQQVGGFLEAAARWLGGMCQSHLSGFQRIRGAALPSGAELRMQLSAIATLLKAISGQTPEASSRIQPHPTASNRIQLPEASDLFLRLLQNSLDTITETASVVAHFELHLVSLYMACVLGQSEMESRVFPIGVLDEPSPLGMVDTLHMARTVLHMQNTIGGWVFQATPDVSLGLHAVVLLTSGPMWSMLQAALGVSLHPFCRLPSYCTFGCNGDHWPTSGAVKALLNISDFISNGLWLVLGQSTPGEDPLHDTAYPFSTTSDVGPASSHGPKPASAAEQRSMVLSCITAANALLHSEALDHLYGLRHMRVTTMGDEPNSGGYRYEQRGREDASGSPELNSNACSGSGESPSGSGESPSGCGSAECRLVTVGALLQVILYNVGAILQRSHAFICLASTAVGDGDLSATGADFEQRLARICFDELEGKGYPSDNSFFDVPIRTEAEATQAGLSMLTQLRSMATELLTTSNAALAQPEQPDTSATNAVQVYVGSSWSRWEVLHAALLGSLPLEQQEDWGRPLWCCNPGCTNLSGPSELQLKTYACGGGCGVRYCSRECQVQGWRLGHRHSCGELAWWQAAGSAPEDRDTIRVGQSAAEVSAA